MSGEADEHPASRRAGAEKVCVSQLAHEGVGRADGRTLLWTYIAVL